MPLDFAGELLDILIEVNVGASDVPPHQRISDMHALSDDAKQREESDALARAANRRAMMARTATAREKTERRCFEALKSAISDIPADQRAALFAKACEEIDEAERRERLLEQLKQLPTDELERRLAKA
jgi:hypothetical protein